MESPDDGERFRRSGPSSHSTIPGRPVIQTTYQLAAELSPGSRESVQDTFEQATRIALNWLKRKFPETIPDKAWRGESFTCELPGQRLEVIGLPDSGLWTARLQHPDHDFGDRVAVGGRTWMNDMSLSVRGRSVGVGVRTQCASTPKCFAPVAFTRPKPVLEWARQMRLYAPIRLSPDPIPIAKAEELDLLYSLLTSPERDLPVVVLTNPSGRRHEQLLTEWVLDPADIAFRLLGFAHVVLLPDELTFDWTKMVGRLWGVFDGAVRVYRPGLDFENQSPFSHPLSTVEKILASAKGEVSAEKSFSDSLVTEVSQYAAVRPRRFFDALFVPEARGKAAEQEGQKLIERFAAQSRNGKDSEDLQSQLELIRESFEREKESLLQQAESSKQEVEGYLELATQIELERDYYKGESDGMRWQLFQLRERLKTSGAATPDENIEIPENFEYLAEWANRHLSGRLILHPRTRRSLKDADYGNVELVYRALLLLANEYYGMRMGLEGASLERFEARCSEMELDFSKSITSGRAGEFQEDYYAPWPIGTSKEEFIEFHLRKGNSKETRYCLAIYFFWDANDSQVVVCWLPSHLPNRMT